MSQNEKAESISQLGQDAKEAPKDQAAQDPPQVKPPVPVKTFLVTCVTSEDERIEVPSHILSLSRVFKNMCENLGIDLGLEVLTVNNQDEGDTEQNEVTEKLQSLALHNGNKDELPAAFDAEFPLVNVNASVFRKVIEWCEEHYGQPDPELKVDQHTLETIHFVYTPFEEKFLDVSIPELQDLLMAANFLDIRSLYLYACQKAARTMMGKTVEQVREEWGFPDDLTEEEKEAIKKEHTWAFKDNVQ
ncbi:skp1 family, dimerization domain-containing protein [Ditylenchus destructor]|uniref:Skp1 family, dimerization domain-containing protein n=1 Tax=Ditylenchus destructor TaxID=166010 RepID=A0AAD4ND95_9BILA|nr:skp1 family, dimerization domain-containing protein [Ditylenchus destructor]